MKFFKDGNTPLDFQERNASQEVQDLLEMHKKKEFKAVEPNPWTWQVWTQVQREKNTLKQLISVSHPNLHGHGHSHEHGHGHGHSHVHSDTCHSEMADPQNDSFCKIA